MAELHVVMVSGGEFDSSYHRAVKAFKDHAKAEALRASLQASFDEERLIVAMVSEWLEEFKGSFPEPKLEYPDMEDENFDLKYMVADEAHRQARAEWDSIWLPALEGKLSVYGKSLFNHGHYGNGPSYDSRNYGRLDDDRIRYTLATLELEE